MDIENYQEQARGMPTIAIFDLYLPKIHLRIHHMKLIRTKKGHLMLSLPSFSVDNADGTKKWTPYIEWSPEKAKEFNVKVMEALKPFLRD